MFLLSIQPNNLLGQTANLFQVDSLLIEAFNQGSFNGNQSALGNAEFIDGNWVSHLHNGESRNFEAILYSNYQKNYTIILLGNDKNRKLFELTDNLIDILESKG